MYAFTGHRGSDWSLEEYLSQWKSNADPIVEAIDMKKGGVTFQGGPFVANVWHPEQVFEGLSDSTSGSLITTQVFLNDHSRSMNLNKGWVLS